MRFFLLYLVLAVFSIFAHSEATFNIKGKVIGIQSSSYQIETQKTYIWLKKTVGDLSRKMHKKVILTVNSKQIIKTHPKESITNVRLSNEIIRKNKKNRRKKSI